MEAKIYRYTDEIYHESNLEEIKGVVKFGYNFQLSFNSQEKEAPKMTLTFFNTCGNYNNFLVEADINNKTDIKDLLKTISELITLENIKKIASYMLIINDYYGGQITLVADIKGKNLLKPFAIIGNEVYLGHYTSEEQDQMLKDLRKIKHQVTKEKLSNVVCGIINSIE